MGGVQDEDTEDVDENSCGGRVCRFPWVTMKRTAICCFIQRGHVGSFSLSPPPPPRRRRRHHCLCRAAVAEEEKRERGNEGQVQWRFDLFLDAVSCGSNSSSSDVYSSFDSYSPPPLLSLPSHPLPHSFPLVILLFLVPLFLLIVIALISSIRFLPPSPPVTLVPLHLLPL